MMFLLDTDVMIDLLRKLPAAVEWFSTLGEPPALRGFVVMELLQGCCDNRDVTHALRLVAPLPVVWPTEDDCNRALADFSKLPLSHRLGLINALIAGCAVGSNATLCSLNEKHYRAVPHLKLLVPYARPSEASESATL